MKAHVKPHVKCMKICVNLNEDLHVKACVKPHVKCMWKYVWKGWHCFTPFSHIFHYAKFHMHVKYVCEMHVKRVWKTCEKSVKMGHFSHVFYMVFHIHTPSSEKDHTLCYLPLGLNWSLNPIMAAWYSFWKLNWCTQTWLSRKTNN